MYNDESIMPVYETSLPTRARDYRMAQADGERVRAWASAVFQWLGSWLVTWGQALQPEQGRTQWQNPPQG